MTNRQKLNMLNKMNDDAVRMKYPCFTEFLMEKMALIALVKTEEALNVYVCQGCSVTFDRDEYSVFTHPHDPDCTFCYECKGELEEMIFMEKYEEDREWRSCPSEEYYYGIVR